MSVIAEQTYTAISAAMGSVLVEVERVASLAQHCLQLEIETWPKPGLVSHVDSGSHADMTAATFFSSASAIRPYFAQLFMAGVRNADVSMLRKIGIQAEQAMLSATAGVNTHRGAIFGMGLLCAAAGWRASSAINRPMTLGEIVAMRWGADMLRGPQPIGSHGEKACRNFRVGGARQEASAGFPSVYGIGLPALFAAQKWATDDDEAARVHACFALIAQLDDTNLLHRGGKAGLQFAKAAAQTFLDDGGVAQRQWRDAAERVHRSFVQRRLSPGGAADLLAMSLLVMKLDARLCEGLSSP